MIARWSPVTKLLLLGAVLAVPYLLWTMPDSGSAPDVARPVTRSGGGGGVAPGAAAPAEPAPASSPAASTRPRALPPLQTFAAVVERPLFAPTRRFVRPFGAPPPEPEPVVEAQEEVAPPPEDTGPERPDLRFFGTIRQGGRVAALVTAAGETGVGRLTVGDAVGGWQVANVTRDRLVLVHEGQELEYSIFGTTDEGSAEDAARDDEPPPPEGGDGGGGDGGGDE